MTKCFILDTNVLLVDPMAPRKFGEHDTIIPMAVLEELDAQKMRKNDLSFDARAAIRTINEIIGDGDAHTGVSIDGGAGKLMVSPDPVVNFDGIAPDSNDNKIIITAALGVQHNDDVGHYDQVILVSNDINMRLKAKGVGVKFAQEYKNDIVVEDSDELPHGYFVVEDGWLPSIPTDQIVRKSCGDTVIDSEFFNGLPPITINDWIMPEDGSWAAVVTDFDNHEGKVYLNFKNSGAMLGRKIAGISPKSLPQAVAVDALLDQDIDIVIIDGAAGSGKTLLALAASTEMIKGKKRGYRHEKIMFTRANVTDFDEVGFLPGTEGEKMAPWLGAAFDNMDVIGRASKNEAYLSSNSILDETKSFIDLKAMMYFRGRSVGHCVLVIDEAQNLTSKQMKTMLTRAGENCKVIVIGNNAQIDNPNVTARSSGLTYVTNKMHGVEFAQVIKLEGVVRSRLAAFAEEEM